MSEEQRTKFMIFFLWFLMLAFMMMGQVFVVHSMREMKDKLTIFMLKEE